MADPVLPPPAPPHPVLANGTFGLMSGEKPMHSAAVDATHENLVGELRRLGLHFEETHGRYEQPERSVIVHAPTREQMQDLGKRFGQDSVVFSHGGRHELLYTNGPHEGKSRLAAPGGPAVEHFTEAPPDYYTHLPGRGYFRINFDWGQDPQHQGPVPGGLAKAEALTPGPAPHPHAYSWHDGHTDHHRQARSLAAIHAAFGLRKDESNTQVAPVGVSSYARFAGPYGQVLGRQNPSSLRFYPYENKGTEIDDLVRRHGYRVYYAGGTYGKPDLAAKNYNTGHLMIYDPGSAGSFSDRRYTDSWRKIHELAHALTYPELNSIYGEGRRIGKLGTHRTPNEAARAVHWEWLAAHKQRELGEQIGVRIPDEHFHRELNTVMHDAVHRAVTGQFTEPGGEGFVPHPHKVPLAHALDAVREEAQRMGIQHPHGLAPKKAGLAKNLPLKTRQEGLQRLEGVGIKGFMSSHGFRPTKRGIAENGNPHPIYQNTSDPSHPIAEVHMAHRNKTQVVSFSLKTNPQQFQDVHVGNFINFLDDIKQARAEGLPTPVSPQEAPERKSTRIAPFLPGHPSYHALRELTRRRAELQGHLKRHPEGAARNKIGNEIGKLTVAIRQISEGRNPEIKARLSQDLGAASGQNPYTYRNPGATYQKEWLPRPQTPAGYVPDVKWKKAESLESPREAGLVPEDTSFDFGANVAPAEDPKSSTAAGRLAVTRMRGARKQAAQAFLRYVDGQDQARPDIAPDLERHLARYGIVDPKGYAFDETGRSLHRRIPGPRRQGRGEEPRDLNRFRLMNQGRDPGYVKAELEKGDVIPFPGNPAPAQDRGTEAGVQDLYPLPDCPQCVGIAHDALQSGQIETATGSPNIARFMRQRHPAARNAETYRAADQQSRIQAHRTLTTLLHAKHSFHRKAELPGSKSGVRPYEAPTADYSSKMKDIIASIPPKGAASPVSGTAPTVPSPARGAPAPGKLASPAAAGVAPSPWMPPSSAETAGFKKLVAAIPPKGSEPVPAGKPTVASPSRNPKPGIFGKLLGKAFPTDPGQPVGSHLPAGQREHYRRAADAPNLEPSHKFRPGRRLPMLSRKAVGPGEDPKFTQSQKDFAEAMRNPNMPSETRVMMDLASELGFGAEHPPKFDPDAQNPILGTTSARATAATYNQRPAGTGPEDFARWLLPVGAHVIPDARRHAPGTRNRGVVTGHSVGGAHVTWEKPWPGGGTYGELTERVHNPADLVLVHAPPNQPALWGTNKETWGRGAAASSRRLDQEYWQNLGREVGINKTEEAMEKNLPGQGLKSPAAAGVAPQLHGTVEGFMGALKTLPKQGPDRGKFITAHMNHPAFLSALQAHPQGKQVHAMLTAHLNSPANAGPKGPMQVTAKAEPPVILPEQGTPMPPVETQYTPAEAAAILRKAAQEKIQALEAQLKDLRKRELAKAAGKLPDGSGFATGTVGKALVPPHKHNTGSTASVGVEDVPAAKLNPPGKDDPWKTAKGEPMEDTPEETSEETSGEKSPADVLDEAMVKEELCKDCGKMHKAGLCKNAMMGYGGAGGMAGGKPAGGPPGAMMRSELTDPKGKTVTTGEQPSATMPDDGSKHVNKPGAGKEAGSGGKIQAGKSLKAIRKAALEPLSKPPVSQAQRGAMGAAAGGSSKLGIPKKVGQEFIDKDPGGKLPAKKAELEKVGAAPPTAKPPSGVNMGTKVPTSAPKGGGMGKEEMAAAPAASSGGTLGGADGAPGGMGKAALSPGMAGKMQGGGATKLTSPNDPSRASAMAGALAGDFQPKGPISSGLELDTKPPKAGGLQSPTAAGMAPKKPGVFGRLGKSMKSAKK